MNTEEYPQQRAALDFFERLHPKLMADFKSTIVNEANKDIKAEPTTVSEMYQRAEAHVSAQRVNPQKPAAAFKTKGKQKNKKQDQRSDDKSDKDGTYQQGNGSQNNVTSHNDTKLSDVECYNCHEMGHHANNCPEQSKARVRNSRNWRRGAEKLLTSCSYKRSKLCECAVHNAWITNQAYLQSSNLTTTWLPTDASEDYGTSLFILM